MAARRTLGHQVLLLAVMALVVLLQAGCATALPPPEPLGAPVDLGFIRDGVSTQGECRQRLGMPSKTIPGSAGGEVWTYWIGRDQSGLRAVTGWVTFEPTRYSLVLSFDAGGVLARHSLVKIWER